MNDTNLYESGKRLSDVSATLELNLCAALNQLRGGVPETHNSGPPVGSGAQGAFIPLERSYGALQRCLGMVEELGRWIGSDNEKQIYAEKAARANIGRN